ncbi:MAG: hypothetical protein K9M98_10190 [Cephaloticoccus sp.]|nr:hypothetical protein [Cephaloticoccus sp.]MCF7760863.1 hypothetical protein [Cephaloticoccus sp.]
MTLTLATLIPGIFLLLLGAALFSGQSTVVATLKAFPRSNTAAMVFFGGGAIWFLTRVWHLSEADFGNYRTLLTIAFGAIALLSFKYVPDFLAVRGLCILVLLSAGPLLGAAFMHYELPQRLLMVTLVYIFIALAIYLGALPYRLRDFLAWLFRTPGRARGLGGILLGYGLLLTITAFTY